MARIKNKLLPDSPDDLVEQEDQVEETKQEVQEGFSGGYSRKVLPDGTVLESF
jgi:hypothetical protein